MLLNDDELDLCGLLTAARTGACRKLSLSEAPVSYRAQT